LDKLKKGVELCGGTRLSRKNALWKKFLELKALRDGLVHYKTSRRLYYNTNELLKRTEKGIHTAGVVIKELYLGHPKNVSYPHVFDTIP